VSPAAQALAEWSVPIPTVATLLLAAAIYARGFCQLHEEMPARFPAQRLCCFIGGIAALMIAIASPLAAFDDLLLQVHMVQHMILMLVAPPLLLLGAPAIPLLRGTPAAIAKPVLGPLLRSRALRSFGLALTHPVVCWLVMAAAFWGWHLPGPYQLALRSDQWHVVEHSCFLGAAILFWWPVVQPWPSKPHWPRLAMIPYLVLGDFQNTILSALLVFSDRLIYPYYLSAPRLGGISALDDQLTAGLIMWVPGSLFYLIPAAAIFLRLLAPDRASFHGSKRNRNLVRHSGPDIATHEAV
jgi:putative membrane protein